MRDLTNVNKIVFKWLAYFQEYASCFASIRKPHVFFYIETLSGYFPVTEQSTRWSGQQNRDLSRIIFAAD